jgi:hypothetical protein
LDFLKQPPGLLALLNKNISGMNFFLRNAFLEEGENTFQRRGEEVTRNNRDLEYYKYKLNITRSINL